MEVAAKIIQNSFQLKIRAWVESGLKLQGSMGSVVQAESSVNFSEFQNDQLTRRISLVSPPRTPPYP